MIYSPGKRDPGIDQLVEHLDRIPETFDDWDQMSPRDRMAALKRTERDAIREQFEMCVEDFAYAARNYFKITTKDGTDQLFTLWESQWIVLQKYYELKSAGKAQKIMILKARQLGMSLLIEALIAWRTMFFPNTNGLVVSVVKEDSSDLFSLMLHIYDHMPWWLKPMRASREEKDGLWFDNPNADQRYTHPGLNSRVYVQHSNQLAGVGQGKKLHAVHVSEYTDFQQGTFEDIVEGDLLHAIPDNPEAFGFLESTGRGAGTYSHRLWKTCEKMAERSEWYPLFLPWFFESTRVLAPPGGWHIHKAESAMRERVKGEWVRCNRCKQFHTAAIAGESRAGTQCPSCTQGNGTLESFVLSDAQLYWKQTRRENAEDKGKDAFKKHKAEMSTTAEESWQISGIAVFDEATQDAVTFTLRDPKKVAGVKTGFLDTHGRFHGVKGIAGGCYVDGCKEDHRYCDVTYTAWEDPKPGCEYAVGVDISEGIGEDYSVIFVNRIGRFGGPDEQVAVFRSDEVEPYDLAFFCNVIGRQYNDALLCIEYNGCSRVTGDRVRIDYQYPNLFRWLNLENVNPITNKWHWVTQYNTKPLLWQTSRKWLKAGTWIVRDPVFLQEMQTFQKDEDDSKSAGHERGEHDDTLMAGMIALYCSHVLEADPAGRVPVPTLHESQDPPRYRMWCETCKFGAEQGADEKYPWGVANPEQETRCPVCGSIQIRAVPLETEDTRRLDFEQVMGLMQQGKERERAPVLSKMIKDSAPHAFSPGAALAPRAFEPGSDYY